MTHLEIVDPSSVPSPLITASDSVVVVVDYSAVLTAGVLAQRAFENTTDREVKQLADAIHSLVGTLTEIVRALDHGKVTVFNYPAEGAHLE